MGLIRAVMRFLKGSRMLKEERFSGQRWKDFRVKE